MPSKALKSHEELMNSVEELIVIHGRIQQGKGRRHGQEALHRAGVVLTIAAWQSYIEKLCLETLGLIENIFVGAIPPPPAWATSGYFFRKPSVAKSVGDLNTPNSQNVIKLLDWSFGCNPKANWVWVAPHRNWTSQQFCDRTDEWLRIRHAIAHGNQLPQNLPWLRNDGGDVRLKLSLLKECKKHFEKKAALTDACLSDHLRGQYGIQTNW